MKFKRLIIQYMGHYNGYIGLPKEHPFFGKGYGYKFNYPKALEYTVKTYGENYPVIPLFCWAIDSDGMCSLEVACPVHGGLTYAGNGCDGMDKDYWYFGFDTGHAGDDREVVQNEKYINQQIDKMEEFFTSLEHINDDKTV